MSEIIVYTTEPCGYCARVKGLLSSRGLEFTEVNLTKDPEGRHELVGRTGMMTFPQVVVDGRLVGGFNETRAAVESGRLNVGPAEDLPSGDLPSGDLPSGDLRAEDLPAA
jgi:glutaredoxin 3